MLCQPPKYEKAASQKELTQYPLTWPPISLLEVRNLQVMEDEQEINGQLGYVLFWPQNIRPMTHGVTLLFGRDMSIIFWEEQVWMVGIQIAKLLQKESFNMYRSMKASGIKLHRPRFEHVSFLKKVGVAKGGTHSVTLVPYQQACNYIVNSIHGTIKRRKASITSPPQENHKNSKVACNSQCEMEISSGSQSCPPSQDGAVEKPGEVLQPVQSLLCDEPAFSSNDKVQISDILNAQATRGRDLHLMNSSDNESNSTLQM